MHQRKELQLHENTWKVFLHWSYHWSWNFTQEVKTASSHLRLSQNISGATTVYLSHNSTSEGVRNQCADATKKKQKWKLDGTGIQVVCVYVCVSQYLREPICWNDSLKYYRGDQSLRKDRQYLNGHWQVFMYDTGTGWLPSDIYTWPDMIQVLPDGTVEGVRF